MIRSKNFLATTFQCTQYVYIPMVFERWYKIQILTDRKINSAQALLVRDVCVRVHVHSALKQQL